jgi:hypothetical protein
VLDVSAPLPDSVSSPCFAAAGQAAPTSVGLRRHGLLALPGPPLLVKAKVLPRPSSLVTVIGPPIRATSREAMVRPRPVPPCLRVVEVSSCSKARKMLSCLSCGMPIPVSLTVKDKQTGREGDKQTAPSSHRQRRWRREEKLPGWPDTCHGQAAFLDKVKQTGQAQTQIVPDRQRSLTTCAGSDKPEPGVHGPGAPPHLPNSR